MDGVDDLAAVVVGECHGCWCPIVVTGLNWRRGTAFCAKCGDSWNGRQLANLDMCRTRPTTRPLADEIGPVLTAKVLQAPPFSMWRAPVSNRRLPLGCDGSSGY